MHACIVYRARGLTTTAGLKRLAITAAYKRTKFSDPFSVNNILICDVGLHVAVIGIGNVDSYLHRNKS